MKYTTKRNQSLVDLSVQLFGSPEFLFTILEDSGLDINSEVSPAETFVVNNETAGVFAVKEFFLSRTVANSEFQKTTGFGSDFGSGFGTPVFVFDSEVAEFVSLKLFQDYAVDTESVSCLNFLIKKLKRI